MTGSSSSVPCVPVGIACSCPFWIDRQTAREMPVPRFMARYVSYCVRSGKSLYLCEASSFYEEGHRKLSNML